MLTNTMLRIFACPKKVGVQFKWILLVGALVNFALSMFSGGAKLNYRQKRSWDGYMIPWEGRLLQ